MALTGVQEVTICVCLSVCLLQSALSSSFWLKSSSNQSEISQQSVSSQRAVGQQSVSKQNSSSPQAGFKLTSSWLQANFEQTLKYFKQSLSSCQEHYKIINNRIESVCILFQICLFLFVCIKICFRMTRTDLVFWKELLGKKIIFQPWENHKVLF